ncbi:MAG: two-component system response regulator [Candidatus Altiarchaeales archaeon HGW-Altiarchaeales-3]|nr:MAG: two-component system response regulator [Candidatus Altiarchaeales archaeon HGW-Altiarchaeales-3]
MELKNRNILLAEDNSDDIELIKRKLRSRKIKCNLFIAKNGEEALNYIWHKEKYLDKRMFPDPDLILLDIRMPKMSGIEVLKEIKSNELLRKIPVVMLTVSTIDKDILSSFNHGCEHYITKSVEFEKFEDTLEPIIKYYLGGVTDV